MDMHTSTATAFVSRYDRRVTLVRDVLRENKKLTDSDCQELAVRLLHAMDTISEKIR